MIQNQIAIPRMMMMGEKVSTIKRRKMMTTAAIVILA
jgi:hypothetical protein